MADVSVYKRSTKTYFWSGQRIGEGDLRLASDAAVTANPQWWVSLTDSDFTTGDNAMTDAT